MNLDAETLFTTYLLPLYPPEVAGDLGALARLRMEDANPAQNPHILARIEEVAEVFVAMSAELFGADLALDRTDASIHRLGAALTRERRDAWATAGNAGTAENQLFNVLVHGVAYVASTIVKAHGGTWLVRNPLWESRVHLTSKAGEAELAILQWWLKSLSDEAFERNAGLADRYRTHVEEPTRDVDALPTVFADVKDRALPRLAKVRYDLLYKYLKAHLPEVRDVGTGFPSPERFDELGFKWLDIKVLGAGRNLLLYGMGNEGLHLFWLGAAGFEKGLFYPSEAFPEPLVRLKPASESGPEKLEVIVNIGGTTTAHEMLWSGL